MESEYKAYLIVRRLGTNEEVHRVGLTSLNESRVEKVMRGMLRNMDTDEFYIDDSEADEVRATAEFESINTAIAYQANSFGQ